MKLFITIEAQNAIESGLADILKETLCALDFLTNKEKDLENIDNYGTEFREIAIIPTCVNDEYWDGLGWKERKQIWRKKREADIRLRMDYERFNNETQRNKRLLFIDVIIKSIRVVQEKSKGDFEGNKLIRDILSALKVSEDEIRQLNGF